MNKLTKLTELEAHEKGIRVVCFDFDGTLCEFAYPKIGEPIQHVLELLVNESKNGSYIVISTCRLAYKGSEHQTIQRNKIINWLDQQGVFDYVNAIVGYKPYADVYVDERAYNPCKDSFKIIQNKIQNGSE